MKIEYTPESLRDLQKIREIIIDRFSCEGSKRYYTKHP